MQTQVMGRRRVIDSQKDTQFTDAWIVIAVVLILIGTLLNNSFLTDAAILLLLTAGLSWLWARYSLAGLVYERRFSEQRAFIGETIDLSLEVTNNKPLPLPWLSIRDNFPGDLPVLNADVRFNRATNLADFSTFWMLGPYQRVTRQYQIECNVRGFHQFGPGHAQTGDAFGFFDHSGSISDLQDVIVYPRVYSVEELQLPTRNPFGEIRVEGSLFEDPLRSAGIREWRPADSMRRVHWKASARQQELVSRVYESSEDHVIQLFLNVATLERHWHGFIPELQERAISVAGSLALLASEQRRPVGLIANGALPGSDQPISLMPGRNPNQLVHILELLAAITPFATKPIEQLLHDEAMRLPWGATFVLITAIAHGELLATISQLAEAGRKIVLFTLAAEPPEEMLHNITVFHLPHLVDDLVAPTRVNGHEEVVL